MKNNNFIHSPHPLQQVLQCFFFGLCVLNDLLGSETVVANRRSALQKLRDGLLSTLVFPLGVVRLP